MAAVLYHDPGVLFRHYTGGSSAGSREVSVKNDIVVLRAWPAFLYEENRLSEGRMYEFGWVS